MDVKGRSEVSRQVWQDLIYWWEFEDSPQRENFPWKTQRQGSCLCVRQPQALRKWKQQPLQPLLSVYNMRFSTFPMYSNGYNYQLGSPVLPGTCMPLHPQQCATQSQCRKIQPPAMTFSLKSWLCTTLSQCKRQVTRQSFKGIFMVLAASDSEHLVIFINILFSAFLQGKKMPLPWFFQVRKRGRFTASFRCYRYLLTLHQSYPCKHPSFAPGQVISGSRSKCNS